MRTTLMHRGNIPAVHFFECGSHKHDAQIGSVLKHVFVKRLNLQLAGNRSSLL